MWNDEKWHMLNMMILAYPDHPTELRQKQMKNLILNLGLNSQDLYYKNYIELNDPDTSSKNNLKEYIWNFHNAMNKIVGKKQFTREEYSLKQNKAGNDRLPDALTIYYSDIQRKKDHLLIDELKLQLEEKNINHYIITGLLIFILLIVLILLFK
jgi:hypothetical protein